MSRVRLIFSFLVFSSGLVFAQYDYNQIVNQVVLESVRLNSNITEWDWEASGNGGYILTRNRDLNADGIQDLIISATVFGEGSGWDVYYGMAAGKYMSPKRASGLPDSIFFEPGRSGEGEAVSYYVVSRHGAYEAYITEYQFSKTEFTRVDFMVDPETIYPNERIPEWARNELEGVIEKYDLVSWEHFVKISNFRSSGYLPETLIVQGILLSDWLKGGVSEWKELDLLKGSAANGYLRFEESNAIFDRSFFAGEALDLALRLGGGDSRGSDSRSDIEMKKGGEFSDSQTQRKREEDGRSQFAGRLSQWAAGLLIVGILLFLIKIFKVKSMS